MLTNNRPVWFVIAIMAVALLMLKIPASWQDQDPAPWAAASATPPGSGGIAPGQGLETPPDDDAVRRWLLDREIQGDADERLEKLVRLGLGGAISIGILFGAFYIALRKGSPPSDRNWAFGTIGAILGFWLGR